LRNYWAQQRTEILTRPMLGINVAENADGHINFEPGVEKATYLRHEISDLRVLSVPRALESAWRFHLKYMRPVLLAQKAKHPSEPPPPGSSPRVLQQHQEFDEQDERAVFLTRQG